MTIHYEKDGFIVRDAEPYDIEMMKDNIREEDRNEVWASDHFTPEQALENSFKVSSEKMAFLVEGEILGMFGIVPLTLMDDRACIWMITTNAIEKYAIKFLRASRYFIKILLERYSILSNFVDVRHKKSVKWLRWSGAIIREPENFGLEQIPFHLFIFGGQ